MTTHEDEQPMLRVVGYGAGDWLVFEDPESGKQFAITTYALRAIGLMLEAGTRKIDDASIAVAMRSLRLPTWYVYQLMNEAIAKDGKVTP